MLHAGCWLLDIERSAGGPAATPIRAMSSIADGPSLSFHIEHPTFNMQPAVSNVEGGE